MVVGIERSLIILQVRYMEYVLQVVVILGQGMAYRMSLSSTFNNRRFH